RSSDEKEDYGVAGVGDLIAVPRRITEREVRSGGQFVLATTAASYLETLNPEQRRAVEHGVNAYGHVGAPLLVIAGAGSGKTNTLCRKPRAASLPRAPASRSTRAASTPRPSSNKCSEHPIHGALAGPRSLRSSSRRTSRPSRSTTSSITTISCSTGRK